MDKFILIIGLLISFAFCKNTNAQDFASQLNYIESEHEDLSPGELIEVWEYYSQNPIDIGNYAEIALLNELLLLSTTEIELIANYCENNLVNSIYQLQVLDIQISSLKRIKPFISCSSNDNNLAKKRNTSFYIGVQFQPTLKEGILNKSYKGSAYKIHTRYRTTLNNKWKLGFNIEKDIGEPLWYKKSGLNNLAINIKYKGTKKLQQINVGRYDITIAEGLLFGTNYRINSPYFLSFNTGKVTKPNLSPKEYNYFEGITASWKLKHVFLDIFSSIRKPNGITSYDQTGLFRTASEIEKHKNLSEQLIGVHILKDLKQSKFTWAGILLRSNIPESNSTFLQSYYFTKSYYNIQLSSELTNQNLNVWAVLLKLNISVGNNSFITLQYRDRDSDMFNEYNSDYSSFSNSYEKGIYTAFQHQLNRYWKIKLAVDYFKATQQQIKSPHYPEGNKLFNELTRTTEEDKFVVQYQFKQIEESNNIQKLRFYYQQEINTQLRWSGKLYCITEERKVNSSLQCNVNLRSKTEKEKISISTCFFNTENESIYWQAPHFYGVYNARFLSGKGSMYSISVQKRVQQKFKFGFQMILLNYIDRDVIGTGNESIYNSSKVNFSVYLKWKN